MNRLNYHIYGTHPTKKSNERNIPLCSNETRNLIFQSYKDIPSSSVYMSQDLYFLYNNSRDIQVMKKVRKGIFIGLKTHKKCFKIGRMSTDKILSKNLPTHSDKKPRNQSSSHRHCILISLNGGKSISTRNKRSPSMKNFIRTVSSKTYLKTF
ncbi:hypothetical protein KSF78_0007561 [Schistosoma japonicum]|nr:hypothetical protein KSF78_0007561 [Schistosoma japonicum]